jgi:RND family efflux transporter MFP subunit
VTAEIRDPFQLVKPGLFGRVDILYETRKNVPLIPRNAIVTEDELSHVFVVGDDSNAARRAVSLGYERNGLVEIIEGVTAGEQVVTAGKGSLSDGTRVEVVGLPDENPGV